jgi:protease I
MADKLQGKRIAFLVAPEGVEQVELTEPWKAVKDEGATPELPGGVANPDFLRMHDDAVAFARAFFEQGKPVGAICHAPWTLVEADVLRGRTITSTCS